MDFGLVLEALGKVLATTWLSKKGPEKTKLKFSVKLRFFTDLGRVLGGSWEGLGTVLGRF